MKSKFCKFLHVIVCYEDLLRKLATMSTISTNLVITDVVSLTKFLREKVLKVYYRFKHYQLRSLQWLFEKAGQREKF